MHLRHARLALVLLSLCPPATSQWSDDLDAYPAGSCVTASGAPNLWEGVGCSLVVDATPPAPAPRSAPNSLSGNPGGDTYVNYGPGFAAGVPRWIFRAQQYAPASFLGRQYWIMLNTYAFGGPYDWSIQVFMDGDQGLVDCDCANMNDPAGPPALVRGQWVEIRADIDLALDVVDVFYDGSSLTGGSGYTWTTGVFGGSAGQLDIQALNLYPDVPGHPNTTAVYYDDFSLVPAPGPIGVPGCAPGVPNSTGLPAEIAASGSLLVLDDDVTLSVAGMPPGEVGYFLVSRVPGTFVPPGSAGVLCLVGDIGRFNRPGELVTGPGGTLAVDLAALPTNASGSQEAQPGETLFFQCWYRDGATSNFSDSLAILFF